MTRMLRIFEDNNLCKICLIGFIGVPL